uniref:Ubiquitin-like domain-containing protein n=1 Tax=viral metagenome TaxID=1070528 RepID=A0A6C0K769_9ZZZZ
MAAPNVFADANLVEGVAYRKLTMVTEALDSGANVNFVSPESGKTPLHIITSMGRPADNAKLVPIVTLLLSRGANPNVQNLDGMTPLMYATAAENAEIMKLLLDAGADTTMQQNSSNRRTALRIANEFRFADGIRLLQERGAVSPVSNPEEDKKLSTAVRMVDKDGVAAALAAGANVNSAVGFFQVTPLHWAMHASTNDQSKMIPIIQLLLEKGADVNLKTHEGLTPFMQSLHVPMFFYMLLKKRPDLTIKTNAGKTVMDIAKGPPRREKVIEVLTKAEAGDWEAATRIAEEDAPPPAPEAPSPLTAVAQAVQSAVESVVAPAQVSSSEQDRALEAAVAADDDAAAQAAILAGANPNMMLHGDRETVLIHYAISENRPMVEFLLDHGADVNGRAGPGADEPGWTALNYARYLDIGEYIEERGGMTARLLDYGPPAASQLYFASDYATPAASAAPSASGEERLRGREDLVIQPITLVEDYVSGADEGVRMETIDVKEVFVANLGRDLGLDQFFRKYMGDGIVFKVGPKFYGIPRKDLIQEYMEGNAIVYECTKTFAMDDPGTRGTFEYSDIYAKPFFSLRTPAGVLYVPLTTMKGILGVSHGFYKVEDKPIKKLENIASRSSVLAGGPVSSQLHCQAGSDGNVYAVAPFKLPDIEEEEEEEEKEEEEEPNVVYVKKGEDKTEFPLDLSQTILQLKEAVKEKLGIAVEAQKMVFQGKILKDDQTLGEVKVGKGYVIQLQVSGGRRFTPKQCKKFTCAKMGFTQKASCRPYKNCYRSTAGVSKKRRTDKKNGGK